MMPVNQSIAKTVIIIPAVSGCLVYFALDPSRVKCPTETWTGLAQPGEVILCKPFYQIVNKTTIMLARRFPSSSSHYASDTTISGLKFP